MDRLCFFLISAGIWISPMLLSAQSRLLETYEVADAQQAVAVSEEHFYVINNHSITKHLKSDGSLVGQWDGSGSGLRHLNSGVVIGDTLYCSHSNFPDSPMASSIEMFDARTMHHVGNHSLGIMVGSATWLVRGENSWYVAFAHYTGTGSSEGKGPEWTQLVRFDNKWRRREAWIFPKEVLTRMAPYSTSGGVWNNDGRLYVSGHDREEVYLLAFPKMGYTLEWIETIQVPIPGQGIAWDPTAENVLWGINRKEKRVIKARLE